MENDLKDKLKNKTLDELLDLLILGLECQNLEKEEQNSNLVGKI